MAQEKPNKFRVRGGKTKAGDEFGGDDYGENVQFEDIFGFVIDEVMASGFKGSRREAERWVISHNKLKTYDGKDCKDGTPIKDIRLIAGTDIVLPVELKKPPQLFYECPPPRQPIPEEEVEIQRETPGPIHAQVTEEYTPVAQFYQSERGARQFTAAINRFDFFLGKEPRDPAAQGGGEIDKRKGDRLAPGYAEGTRTRLDLTNEAARGQGEHGKDRHRHTYVSGRAGETNGRDGEYTYRPSQIEFVEHDLNSPNVGQIIGQINKRFRYKFEETQRFIVDDQGNLCAVVSGSALISEGRRLNPEKGNDFSDASTARNVVTKMNETPEGLDAMLTYIGIQRGYDKYTHNGAGPANYSEAEKAVQLKAEQALHVLTWSMDPQGVPIGNYETIRQDVRDAIEKANIPEAEKEKLRQQYYNPYFKDDAVLKNPEALEAAIAANGGRANWINPLQDWVPDRIAEVEKSDHPNLLRKGYSDLPGIDGRKLTREQQDQNVYDYGMAVSVPPMANSVRPPTEIEKGYGSGKYFDSTRQQAPGRVEGQLAFLDALIADPVLRRQYFEEVARTPGAFEKLGGAMFDATRKTGGNSRAFGYTSDRQADRGIVGINTNLLGAENRKKLNYSGGSILLAPFSFVADTFSLGLIDDTDIRSSKRHNQIRGVADGTPEAFADRVFSTDPAIRDQVDAGGLEYLIRARKGLVEFGAPQAVTAAMEAVNPQTNEDANGHKKSASFIAFENALPPRARLALYDHMVANRPGAAGDIETGTDAQILSGNRNIRTVSREQLDTMIANGKITTNGQVIEISPEQVTAAIAKGSIEVNGKTINLPAGTTPETAAALLQTVSGGSFNGTLFNTEPANRARDAIVKGDANARVLAANVMANTSTPTLASQNSVTSARIQQIFSNAQILGTLSVIEALADGNKDDPGMRSLRAALDTMDHGGGESSRMADFIEREAANMRKAGPANRGEERERLAGLLSELLTVPTAEELAGMSKKDADKAVNAVHSRQAQLRSFGSDVSNSADTSSLLAGSFSRLAGSGGDNASFLAGLKADGLINDDQILAITAGDRNAFESWKAGVEDQQNSHNAGKDISRIAVLRLFLFVGIPLIPNNPVTKIIECPDCIPKMPLPLPPAPGGIPFGGS